MKGFLDGSDSKESTCNAEDLGLISGLGGSPGEGNGNPFQCSCSGNPMDREACRLQSMESKRVKTQLGDFHFTFEMKN